jgi:hypothetical protein
MNFDPGRGTDLVAAWPILTYPYVAAYARPATAAVAALVGAAAAGGGLALGRHRTSILAPIAPLAGALTAAYLIGSVILAHAVRSSYDDWVAQVSSRACGVSVGMSVEETDRRVSACGRVVLHGQNEYSLEPDGLARLNPAVSGARTLRVDLGPDGRVAQASGN